MARDKQKRLAKNMCQWALLELKRNVELWWSKHGTLSWSYKLFGITWDAKNRHSKMFHNNTLTTVLICFVGLTMWTNPLKNLEWETAFSAFQVFNLRKMHLRNKNIGFPQDSLQQIHTYFTLLWTMSTLIPRTSNNSQQKSIVLRPGKEELKSWVLLFLTKRLVPASFLGQKDH